MDKQIEMLRSKLNDKVAEIDRRLKKCEKDSLIDHSEYRERLHSEAREYERVLKMIDDLFPSDPIPLPTIKRYRCGECKRSENAYEWNRETELYFRRTMPQIDENGDYNATFVCPRCGEGQPRHTIGKVNP